MIPARPQDRVLERVRLLLAGVELFAQPLVDRPLSPKDMDAAVQGQVQIAGFAIQPQVLSRLAIPPKAGICGS